MEGNFFFISVFLAGILSFFSPCIFPLLPVYIGLLLDTDEPRSIRILGQEFVWYGLVKTLCFIMGLSTVFFILGFGAGAIGSFFYATWFRYMMGIIIILLGLHQMEILHFQFLQYQKTVNLKRNAQRNDFWTAFLLGSAASGSSGAIQGSLLTLIYTAGMALPFLILALASSLVMRYFSKIKPYMGILKKIGGALIVLMGILLLLGQVNSLSGLFG